MKSELQELEKLKLTTKQKIRTLLVQTGREGMGALLDYMEEIGFFLMPASTHYHGAYEGALAEHSLNVLNIAEKWGVAAYGGEGYNAIHNSVVICSLLHDVGKCGQFGKPGYIPNFLTNGEPSDKKPFEVNKSLLNVPHEVRSIDIISRFVDLTENEQFAILMHNGLYGPFYKELKSDDASPLYMLIHFADMWASRVIEK